MIILNTVIYSILINSGILVHSSPQTRSIIFILTQLILNLIRKPLIKWMKMDDKNNDAAIICIKRMNQPILTDRQMETKEER